MFRSGAWLRLGVCISISARLGRDVPLRRSWASIRLVELLVLPKPRMLLRVKTLGLCGWCWWAWGLWYQRWY